MKLWPGRTCAQAANVTRPCQINPPSNARQRRRLEIRPPQDEPVPIEEPPAGIPIPDDPGADTGSRLLA